MFSTDFFFFENRTVYEIMWKKYCRTGQTTIDNMAHAYCMLDNWGYKHTHTHSEYVILIAFPKAMGRDSSVGIAPRYGLDDPGIESRWGRDFPHPSIPAPGGLPSLLYNGYRVFPGGKAAGAFSLLHAGPQVGLSYFSRHLSLYYKILTCFMNAVYT
jgi:hypothetical protein